MGGCHVPRDGHHLRACWPHHLLCSCLSDMCSNDLSHFPSSRQLQEVLTCLMKDVLVAGGVEHQKPLCGHHKLHASTRERGKGQRPHLQGYLSYHRGHDDTWPPWPKMQLSVKMPQGLKCDILASRPTGPATCGLRVALGTTVLCSSWGAPAPCFQGCQDSADPSGVSVE